MYKDDDDDAKESRRKSFSFTPFYDFQVNVHLWWLHVDFWSLFN